MKVPYVESAQGSVLEDHGMARLGEEVSEGFTRLESGKLLGKGSMRLGLWSRWSCVSFRISKIAVITASEHEVGLRDAFNTELWKSIVMRCRCCVSVGIIRADCASIRARVAREEERVEDVESSLVVKMPSSMITSGERCDSGSLVLDSIKFLKLFLFAEVDVHLRGALEMMRFTLNERKFLDSSVRSGSDEVLDGLIARCIDVLNLCVSSARWTPAKEECAGVKGVGRSCKKRLRL